MHNYFTIISSGKTVKSYNTLHDIFPTYALGARLCEYIYIVTASGETVFKAAKPCANNFDPCRGTLYACYETTLDANELAGQTIISTGFAYAQNRGATVNSCTFNLTKNAGEKVLITGSIYMENIGEKTKFCGGENALVKALLGGEKFPLTGFELAAGNNFMPSFPFERGDDSIIQKTPCNAVFCANKINFNAALSQPANETLLLLNGIPVMRCRPDTPLSVTIEYLTAAEKGAVNLDGKFITDVSNVRVNNTAIIDYTVSSLTDAAHLYCRSPYKIPNTRVFADPSRRFFAAVDSENITLYKAENGGLIPYFWTKGTGVSPCGDGAAFVFSAGNIKYIKDEERNFIVPTGTKTEAVYNNAGYLAAAFSGGSVLLHRVDNNLNVTTTTIDYGGEDVYFINFGTAVGVIAQGKQCRVFTPIAEDAQLAAWLNANSNYILNNLNANPFFDAGRLIFNRTQGDSSYIDYPQAAVKIIEGKGRIAGEFLYRFNQTENKTAVYSLSNTAAALFQVSGEIKNIFSKSDMLYIFLTDGALETYLLSSKRSKLVSPSISAGDTVSCYVTRQEERGGSVSIGLAL